ncbi:TadE/TadG family type IV pilus assembly protein [Aurantiacibacter gangjinensis]|uniref:Uncharacterized protein n=1 Tax=Aurantiacibacter gangjinensis TaxID=502682 RepID=A0A0G9MQC6_9SPHN|nr:TadE/TadG family type IV pilus assembly protein [Aurantiacibacter gangjinensis]APE28786.1 hypothetical protein BMF35_a1957 [Aurantiacibacter gangjinensis]KLE32937.1 hypothetical protein AAW01_02680 [Aurantiacibacter gangjinensis]
MMRALARVARITRDERGSMAIETAFVAPVLLIMALGGFEVSNIVARQTELQSAAAEAAAVVRAVIPETVEDRDTVRDILATSICETAVPNDTASGAPLTCGTATISVEPLYRCGTATDYITNIAGCATDVRYDFIEVQLQDNYTPIWVKWGVSDPVDYNVIRTVQIG